MQPPSTTNAINLERRHKHSLCFPCREIFQVISPVFPVLWAPCKLSYINCLFIYNIIPRWAMIYQIQRKTFFNEITRNRINYVILVSDDKYFMNGNSKFSKCVFIKNDKSVTDDETSCWIQLWQKYISL